MKITGWTGERELAAGLPVLIAGPTASGKSDLALQIAETQGASPIAAEIRDSPAPPPAAAPAQPPATEDAG